MRRGVPHIYPPVPSCSAARAYPPYCAAVWDYRDAVGGVPNRVICALVALPTPLIAAEGIDVQMASAFGTEQLPTGLRVLIGRRAA
jgi:hypothetical protein